jgi:glycosyltransferase involved in cell wall biosynthesis
MFSCTVAIPVYNRPRGRLNFVALDSALAQDLPGLEILVVDDASTDGTWDRLRDYQDDRLRLVRNEQNVGLFGNFNRCLALARGDYVRILCSDDRLLAGCLRREVELMESSPGVALLSTAGRYVDEQARPISQLADHFPPGVYRGADAVAGALWFQAHYGYNPFNFPSGILLRRAAAVEAGRFDTGMRVAGDIDFFLRVLSHGDLGVTDGVGCEVTLHADQVSIKEAVSGHAMQELFAIFERHRPLLEGRRTYGRILRQHAAVCYGLAVLYRWSGKAGASRLHREIARSRGAGWLDIGLAGARLLTLRLLLKATGLRLLPVKPYRTWGE